MSTRIIRYANLNDSEILGKIHSESSKAGFKGIIPDSVLNDTFSFERRTKRFISELSIGAPKTAIVFDNNEPVGFISFGRCRYGNNDKSWIEIWRVYVIQEFWGCSASKELIEWGIREIIKENFNNIELWVLEKNVRGRSFYEKVGFKYDNTFQITDSGKELRYIKVKDIKIVN
jgi:RimJ/RimL family protein N-acetyltransferase